MILVTGGTGLVGSHLLYDLISAGNTVRALKRKESNLAPIKHIFSYYTKDYDNLFNKIEWVEGDVLDYFSLLDAMEGIDTIYHTAGYVAFEPSERDLLFKVNVEGTKNMVNAALEMKVKRFCYVSSIAALGREKDNQNISEKSIWKDSPNNSIYAISKYLGEKEVWRGEAEGLSVVIVNPGIIIGPGFWERGSGKMVKLAWDGLLFYTYGINGFVDVRDVTKAMIKLTQSDITNQRFVLVSENVVFKNFYEMLSDEMGVKRPTIHATKFASAIIWRLVKLISFITFKTPIITKETAHNAQNRYFYANDKIKEAIGFEFIPFDETLKNISRLFLKDYKK